MATSNWCWPMPAHVKNVPCCKSDVGDADWLADLLLQMHLLGSIVSPSRSEATFGDL